MSVLVASFLDYGKLLVMGADSRTCVIQDGETYYTGDHAVKLYDNGDGLVFYCSGAIDVSHEVAQIILAAEYVDSHLILRTLKETYQKHLRLTPEIANVKHALQFVIPNKNKEGIWELTYLDSETNFEPIIYRAKDKHYCFAIGKGAKVAHPIIDKGLEEHGVSIKNLYLEAFSQAADETCGGTLSLIAYTLNGVVRHSLPIEDRKPLRKLIRHAQGDGVIVTPDGDPVSGAAYIEKHNNHWNLIYRNNNYAKERRLIMQDDGVELSTETGDIVIGHDVGSYIKLKSTGDIEIHAVGKIEYSGNEYNFQ